MIKQKIAIIGVGHIGQALLYGLLNGKAVKPQNLTLANPHLEKLRDIKSKFKLKVTTSNIKAAKTADIIIIAVKSKVVKLVVEEIRDNIKPNALIISVAACLTLDLLADYFKNKTLPIVRIMPNIPIAYGKGVVGWIGNKNINLKDKRLINSLLASFGYVVEHRSEEKLDKLTLIAGCGPGYVGYFMDSLLRIAQKYGFSKREAENIVEATLSGTLYHLEKTSMTPHQLIESVSTKEGLTETIIKNLDENNFDLILSDSIKTGYAKMKGIIQKLEK